MVNFLKNRKENKLQEKALSVIKQNLSEEFKRIDIKVIENVVELSDMILYGANTAIKARIDKENIIQIKIEDINGFLFEGFTENYKWFLETFSF